MCSPLKIALWIAVAGVMLLGCHGESDDPDADPDGGGTDIHAPDVTRDAGGRDGQIVDVLRDIRSADLPIADLPIADLTRDVGVTDGDLGDTRRDTGMVDLRTRDRDLEAGSGDAESIDLGGGLPSHLGRHSMVQVSEQVSAGETTPYRGVIYVVFFSGPDVPMYELVDAAGACRYYRVLPNEICEPPCGEDEICSREAVCVPAVRPLSAGTVTIEGLVSTATAAPTADTYYEVDGPDGPELFEPGDAIAVRAVGEEVPAFTATVRGVSDMVTDSSAVVLEDGIDNSVSWTPQGDGAVVELVLQLGWHGNPPTDVIFCTAPEDEGVIVIPQRLVEQFPYFTVGLFQVPSWLRRVNRQIVATASGPVEVSVFSESWISVTH